MKRLLALTLGVVLIAGASADKLTQRQRALHVLNRLAFGPRPGDVDRLMRDGVDVWIEQQLHPGRIPDRAIETRLESMPTLKMSSAEVMEKYYAPIVKMRRERKNDEAAVDPAM